MILLKEFFKNIWFSIKIIFISYICGRIAFPESLKEYDLYVLGPISFLICMYGFMYFISSIFFFINILSIKVNAIIDKKIKSLISKLKAKNEDK
ncbi:hypothetical protein N5912_00840 [Arcobacter lacus]|uniref:hypothetical protein n=1 Tax=Arcobacter lacus TaxID=1912876 RepID=UPI0021BA55C0|nr:hypothetical protein [Arcobacter lacus]MCT7910365.1 hypothetical protein [Arcobacter lacus]